MKKLSRSNLYLILLILACIAIHFISRNQFFVEGYYSKSFYVNVGKLLRICFGFMPFSWGDILYAILLFLLIRNLGLVIIHKIRSPKDPIITKHHFYIFANFSCVIYLVFNVLWGINYNRLGIAHQLNLKAVNYSTADLILINQELVQKVNLSKSQLSSTSIYFYATEEMFNDAFLSYQKISDSLPFIRYEQQSVKKSLWGWAGNYLGFSGYYNPFTGEAQINTDYPSFLQPFVTCHEMAHQLGYAKENEANFVGFLVSRQSSNLNFKYAGYLEMLLYANRNLYNYDSVQSKAIIQQLSKSVWGDLRELNQFYKKYKNPLEPIINKMYGVFLKSNQQPQGIRSYDEVTYYLIAYFKKQGQL